jgi:uncharacterized protein
LEHELRTIYETQKIDTEIQENEKKMLLAPRKMEEMAQEIAETKARIDKQQEIVEELDKERRKKEKELEVDKEKIKKFESRLYEVKTNKEYQALLKEIEAAKQVNDKTEEETILLMEKIEELRGDSESASKSMKQREKEIEAEKAKLQAELASFDETLKKLKRERNNLLSVVSDTVRQTYEMLIQRRSGVAVVNVKNGLCLGCYMNIPPQLFIEAMKNCQLILCPSCNRILYFLEEA